MATKIHRHCIHSLPEAEWKEEVGACLISSKHFVWTYPRIVNQGKKCMLLWQCTSHKGMPL